MLEGVNEQIKVIKRMAYGFRDSEYFLKIKAAFPGKAAMNLFTREKGEPWLPSITLPTRAYFLPGCADPLFQLAAQLRVTCWHRRSARGPP